MDKYKTGKDLTKEAPRSPNAVLGGYKILSRTIDKCRASLWGDKGEYHFDCPLDNMLFGFKGINGSDFKAYVAEGHSDEEIAQWVSTNGQPKTDAEIQKWNQHVTAENYASLPEKKEWLSGENKRLGLDADSTLFEFLDEDDRVSYKK